ncbi:hypothetical protein M1N22_02180 [Dehalococcoidia bacterium]|nr:hypothetical protein [Dehalococcoidia bacterium]
MMENTVEFQETNQGFGMVEVVRQRTVARDQGSRSFKVGQLCDKMKVVLLLEYYRGVEHA